jgi:tetratricopeptide (TPR) repeat protein
MSKELPRWARRIRSMREARGWSHAEAARRMREHADKRPAGADLARQWMAWELAENKPGPRDQPIIAATLGTATTALFPPQERVPVEPSSLSATGMDPLEVVGRLTAASVNSAAIDAIRITVERLCCEYSSRNAAALMAEARQWLRRLIEMQAEPLALSHKRDTVELAGWLALLVGCLEYDMGDRRAAEATRRAALDLGRQAGSAGVLGWAHEMRAWFAITSGDYGGAVAAARGGLSAAGNHGVAVQLIAQEAKAHARMGNKQEMLDALERGRSLLDTMPYPGNIGNHFVVDPSKFDFYAMDCYRRIGENDLARELADEVVRTSTVRRERWPMRTAEGHLTLGVVAAREGDLDQAVSDGRRALAGDRKSLPSLAMVSRDLVQVLTERYGGEPVAEAYLEELRAALHHR